MNTKKRLLFIGEAVSLAHVSRPFVLARSLNPLQYEIHFACDPGYKSLLNLSPDIHYWPIESISSKSFITAANRGGFVLQKWDIESYVRQELALIEKVEPSLIISDFRQTVSISAEIEHIPYASLANVHWSPYRILGFNPVPEIGKSSARKRILAKLMPWKEQSATASFNVIRKKYNQPLFRNYCDLVTHGDYTLYTEPPNFIQTLPLPPRHVFLGPVLWSPEIPKPGWWQAWDPDLPLIYVTLGSTGVAGQLSEITRILKDLPINILVASAGRVKLLNKHPNVFIADYLPGIEISRLASVVICSGGSATAYQALSQGTPVLGIWSNIDQYLTSMVIERHGAGICCNASKLDLITLKQIIEKMIGESQYKTKAAELATSFQSYDAILRFQQFIDNLHFLE